MKSATRILALAGAAALLAGGLALAAPPQPGVSPKREQPPPTETQAVKKPDLRVAFKDVQCPNVVDQTGKYPVNAKLDIRNYPVPDSQHKTWVAFETRVTLSGQPLSPNPHTIPPPMWGGQHQETNFTIKALPGTYTLVATVDWNNQQPELNENNNTATHQVIVPGGPC